MLCTFLERVSEIYPVRAIDPGEFRTLKISGMTFQVYPFDAVGLGRLCLMDVSGMMGLMKMQTAIINPFELDAPLLSYDRILVGKKDSLYLELFATTLGHRIDETELLAVKKKYVSLPDKDTGTHWYDDLHLAPTLFKSGKNCSAQTDRLVEEFLDAYLIEVCRAPACDAAAKKECSARYSNGLIEKGGPATDPFSKQLGRENTKRFFREVLFGT